MIGVACPQSGQTVGLLSPSINVQVMNVFLEQFAAEIDPDVQLVMIWDQAGFHCAKDLRLPVNVTILPLPPYSPELNPIENLWHYLRSHHWSNREYVDYNALPEAATAAWRTTCLDPEIIKTVCNAPFLEEREVRQ